MSRVAWITGVAGGVLGAAATTVAVGAARKRHRLVTERARLAVELAENGGPAEPVGLPAAEASSVVADDGVRLSCEVVPPADGRRPALTVVLVHGFALDRRCWQLQRGLLAGLAAPAVRQVLYDQRSHGTSDRAPRESCTIERLAADLDAVLRALVPTGPVVLVGHSMGGMTVLGLADQYPELFGDRIVGVGLLSTTAGEIGAKGLPGALLSRRNPLTRGVGTLARIQPRLVEGVRRAASDLIWAITRDLAYGDRSVDPALVDLVDRMIASNAVDALADFVDTLGRHDRVAALRALQGCEVLVAAGDGDRLIPFRHSEVIAAELPEATMLALPGVGHLPMLERPDAVDEALVALLERAARRARRGSRKQRRA